MGSFFSSERGSSVGRLGGGGGGGIVVGRTVLRDGGMRDEDGGVDFGRGERGGGREGGNGGGEDLLGGGGGGAEGLESGLFGCGLGAELDCGLASVGTALFKGDCDSRGEAAAKVVVVVKFATC